MHCLAHRPGEVEAQLAREDAVEAMAADQRKKNMLANAQREEAALMNARAEQEREETKVINRGIVADARRSQHSGPGARGSGLSGGK